MTERDNDRGEVSDIEGKKNLWGETDHSMQVEELCKTPHQRARVRKTETERERTKVVDTGGKGAGAGYDHVHEQSKRLKQPIIPSSGVSHSCAAVFYPHSAVWKSCVSN